MQELTFGRLRSYPKPITPEIEAKREAKRIQLRKLLNPSHVAFYDKAVVIASDEDLKAIVHTTFEQIHVLYPEIDERLFKNWITLAGWERDIRLRAG